MAATVTSSTPPAGLHDILYHILSHLTPSLDLDLDLDTGFLETKESRSARNALACLARSHSSFTWPALATLWRSLPSEEPLEHLLCVVGIARAHRPLEQCQSVPSEDICRTLITHSGPGWRRFQEYTSLVHEIIIDPFVSSEGVPSMSSPLQEDTFWCRLSSSLGDKPVLPRLDTAILRSIRSLRPFDTGLLRLLVAPTLRKLDIILTEAPEDEDELELLKRALIDCLPMPQLEVLSLETENPAPFLDTELLHRLRHNLHTLKLGCSRPPGWCHPIEFSGLRHLTALPNLTRLSICLHSWEPLDLPTPIVFSTLHSFELSDCYEFGVIDTLFAHVEFPRLRTFAVTETHEESYNLSQKIPSRLHTLIAKCPALTMFAWTCKQTWHRGGYGYGHPNGRRSNASLAVIIAPLLAHRAIHHFSLSFRGPIVPHSPADLRAMAEAWPDLETFDLDDEVGEDEDCDRAERYVDVECVVTFARCCPRLRSFHIPAVHFDPSAAVVGEWARHCPPERHWLREFLVQRVIVFCRSSGDLPERRDEDRRREDVVRFRTSLATVFRSAVIRSRSELAVVMTVDSVVSDH